MELTQEKKKTFLSGGCWFVFRWWWRDQPTETETGFGFNPEPVSLNRIRPKAVFDLAKPKPVPVWFLRFYPFD